MLQQLHYVMKQLFYKKNVHYIFLVPNLGSSSSHKPHKPSKTMNAIEHEESYCKDKTYGSDDSY